MGQGWNLGHFSQYTTLRDCIALSIALYIRVFFFNHQISSKSGPWDRIWRNRRWVVRTPEIGLSIPFSCVSAQIIYPRYPELWKRSSSLKLTAVWSWVFFERKKNKTTVFTLMDSPSTLGPTVVGWYTSIRSPIWGLPWNLGKLRYATGILIMIPRTKMSENAFSDSTCVVFQFKNHSEQ